MGACWRFAAAGRFILSAAVIAGVFALTAGVPAVRAESYFGAIKRLVEAGKYDEALAVSKVFSQDPEISKLNVAFTEALILKRKGDLPAAAAKMRAILADNPRFARVRQELAHTLYLMGDKQGALYHFEMLADRATTVETRSLYDDFIDRSRNIRPWSLGGYVSLAPSTNINNATDADVVYIGGIPFVPNQGEESGVGLNYGLNGTYRFDLEDRNALTFGAGVSGVHYRKQEFDTTRFEGFSELSHQFDDRWTGAVGLSTEYVLKGGEAYRWSVGPVASLKYSMGQLGTTTVRASWRTLEYVDADSYDGSETALGLRHNFVVTPTVSVLLGLDLAYVSAAYDYNAYAKYRVFGKVYKQWSYGILTDLQLGAQLLDYQDDFLLMDKARQDRRIDATMGVTLRSLSYKGFAPRLEYSYVRNLSNVGLYDYDNQTVALFLTKKF